MEMTDLELINGLMSSNQELQGLMKEHQELELKLENLNKKAFLTAEDQAEKKRLQKLKLRGRDRIEEILAAHRH